MVGARGNNSTYPQPQVRLSSANKTASTVGIIYPWAMYFFYVVDTIVHIGNGGRNGVPLAASKLAARKLGRAGLLFV